MRLIKTYSIWSCLLLFLVACSTSPSALPTSSPSARTVTPLSTPTPEVVLGGSNCQPPSPRDPHTGEVQATTIGGEIWALPIGNFKANTEAKIIWKVALGAGDFQVVALGPHGIHATSLFEPELHLGSNWKRPGTEWGTGFSFPIAGCYDFHVISGKVSGDMWLVVT